MSLTLHDLNKIDTILTLRESAKHKPPYIIGVKIIYLSANSMGVSPGFRFCGSKYQTSQTTAQDVISCNRCLVNDCLQASNAESLLHQ